MTDFEAIVRGHALRYPLMQPQDFGKLAYQSEFGPEHMIADEPRAAAMIISEWQAVEYTELPLSPEPIGNGLCRFHLTRETCTPENALLLAQAFAQSAREHAGTRAGLDAKIKLLKALPVEGMETWLSTWRGQGCPPVHHSDAFRAAYRPHYRVIAEALAEPLLARIAKQP
ncbi:MAG TPA: hypothetical protein PKU80_08635 [Candidatus Limiplasma sp.]|nr:hypothetical protein [Candidatus Limiplasma sp.]HRX08239.1 hypothetical protein [Candidatus Limiplasma sp.]